MFKINYRHTKQYKIDKSFWKFLAGFISIELAGIIIFFNHFI